ncbi:hypothetical protein EK21DRAFT_90966 [Setomelanomma holmii]|uniref:Cyanophycinase n=1 Tax=Setomelanomma holmii TaxID=210430 RepID=A0A9P4H731_9PLEO|nr:hypothetical protein EK21DRAFT_90966 [Setomelanomma holmii]
MLLSLFFSAFVASAVVATPINSTNTTFIGPEHGYLVIVGSNLQSDSIWQRIIDLAGGPDAPQVVVPQLAENQATTRVSLLHTYDPTVADTDEFIAPMLEAEGIFFGGGRQWRLVDAYAGTKTELVFQAVLDRGDVISGSSAGASIIRSFLARGDTANNQIMIGDHTVGFGYLKNTAIDQHVLIRNRHFDMFDILREYPELLGLAVDEDTALIVHQNEAEVFGSTYALIYDGGFWSREGSDLKKLPREKFYFLKPGDKYALSARKVISPATTSGDEA